MRHPVINTITITGIVSTDPESHAIGSHRFPILAFVGETVESREGKPPRTVRWRAKIFGATAEQAKVQIAKGLWVLVRGRLSGYSRPGSTGERSLPEIEVQEYWLVPPPTIVTRVELQDGPADED
jgi:single-stranded DNA-binding protein